MTEIAKTFAKLKADREGALIAYLTAGDPNLRKNQQLAEALIKGGADILELGIPFSDPIADGPVIQNAVSRSLANGCRPIDVLNIARAIRDKYDVPIVLMTYFNPIFRYGLSRFIESARKSGVSGMIIPDLPVEEAHEYKAQCSLKGIDTIFLASPSTSESRLKKILTETTGYLYLVSMYGVTGIRTKIPKSAIALIKRYHTTVGNSLPLAVGFGISTPQHVKQVMKAGADGAIIGSAFVKIIEDNLTSMPRATRMLRELAQAMKRAATGK